MEKQKVRSEIEEQYKWDLTTIFKSDELWYQELEKVNIEVENIEKFRGNIVNSASNLLKYLKFEEALDRRIKKLDNYASLKYDEDTTNSKYQEMYGKINLTKKREAELYSFVDSEMFSIDYSKIKEYIKEEKALEEYKFTLESFYRFKKHKLSEVEERMISSLSNVLCASEETYGSLTDSDLKFGYMKDENGENIELTESNFYNLISSNNREVRKNAFTLMYETYSNYKNTLSTLYKSHLEFLTEIAKIKKFNNSLESSLFSENIDVSVYNNLIDTVNKNFKVVYKYYNLKKEILNLDEIHLYDVCAQMVGDLDKDYSYEEAKEILFKALAPLGENYLNDLKKAFDERWIDVYNNTGKRSGAYSGGFYDTNPFVLLNYEGKLYDVATLAHELGHSMHTYYSCKNNSYTDSDYQIFVAEVASTVNEVLLYLYLINNSNDNKEKLYVLNELLELFRQTIYRQVMFAEFEKLTHELTEKGEILTSELLTDEYYKLNQKYFGSNVVVDELIKYEWERIPHFYYNFYVYKYAIGISSACHIVNNILEGKENALENYLSFLKSGGSDYPANELKITGVDVTKPEVVESAIKMFDETIDKFQKVYKKTK